MTTIKMPQLGESVTEGTIERWLVKEGDTVAQYDPLFEVVTDKVNAEVPAEVAGTITKIMVPDGETVKVGTPLAEISADGDGAAPAPSGEAPAEAAPAETAPADVAPQPAPEQVEATPAQPEMPAQPNAATEPAEPQEVPATQPAPAATAPAAPAAPAPASGDGSARMTPAVRRLVREHNIDISQLHGTGAGGRVTREDVLAFVAGGAAQQPATQPAAQPAAAAPAAPAPQPAQPAAAPPPAPPTGQAPAFAGPAPVPAPTGGDVEVPLSQMRKGIAAKMTRVKQTVPHAYTVVEVDMHNVVRWRESNNASYREREGIGLSYVAAVVKAVTETLRQHPTLNSQFAEDRVILKQAMNIGIAVAVDNGLLVPVIHDADQLSISGVNHRIQDLAARARTNKLKLDEIQGGTFTVNNTGWFGSVSSMPIINAPEVAILSMEAIVKRPVVTTIEGEDVIVIRPMMNMTCSFDHRVLDGAQVGAFMSDVRKRLEEWDPQTPIG
ncbi:MAG TPA: dihydrolipoamide acetyltransferase family protein [Candidatus Limnocylindria bacterium]|nr:dihydrolipoamide acetyltransferase family protein [Candidatus Limnocylindria bacterium]